MGCSAGKNPALDRIPSTSSSADHKGKENGNSNNSAHLASKRNHERRDTGSYEDGSLVNGNYGNHDRHQQSNNSLIDYSATKKHKDIPLSGPLSNNNKQISKSQTDFFKMLDEKIEKGRDFEAIKDVT